MIDETHKPSAVANVPRQMAAKTPLKPAAKKARYCAVFVPNKYKFYAQFWLILKYKKRHGGALMVCGFGRSTSHNKLKLMGARAPGKRRWLIARCRVNISHFFAFCTQC